MRRAERLFQLLNLLRNRRTVMTARQMGEALDVSERTIYRDIQALSLSGVPIEGEAGVGYRLQRHFQLPPLMFDRDEVEALLLGARMIRAWGDKKMAGAAAAAMQKILAVLPEGLRDLEEDPSIQVPTFGTHQQYTAYSDVIRAAIRNKHIIRIDYRRADGEFSSRELFPLGLVFWGRTWTMIAWCELRKSYREFRLDRIESLEETVEHFETSETRSLNHYLSLVRENYSGQSDNACQSFSASVYGEANSSIDKNGNNSRNEGK